MKKTATKTTIIIALLVVAMVGYYTYLSNKTKVRQDDATMTLVQSTLGRNLAVDYPSTPKEVMKYYHDIMKCWYDENTSDSELTELGLKARELYDEKLLEINPEKENISSLKSDVAEFRNKKRKFTSLAVPGSTNVDIYTIDGESYARIICTYTVVEGGVGSQMKTAYLLHRDENKRWKIYGWEPASELEVAGAGN